MPNETSYHKEAPPRYFRLPAVMSMYNLSKSSIYRGIKNGSFPKPVRLGRRAVGWDANSLKQWEEQLKGNLSVDNS